MGLGHPGEAADALLRVAPEEGRLIALVRSTVPDLIEALMRAGRPVEEGEAPLERFRHIASMSTGLRPSLIARCEALLGKRPPEEAFTEALELADALSQFEPARTELLYGEWLRRERRRKEARTHLRAAAEEFDRLGAKPWQKRAEAELRATGETARKREPSTLGQLTPQELQIAQLAAEGYTNPEIAGQLFLSPRTVEYHLHKVFSKLGIAGRNELIRRGDAAIDDSRRISRDSLAAPVLTEIARVLRPGGRLGISDILAEDALTGAERAERGSYVGCIAGALSSGE